MATTNNASASANAEQRIRVIARQHDTVDALCWRHLGRTAGTTEATLAANPGLAATARLQPGQPVTLVRPAKQHTPVVQLWN